MKPQLICIYGALLEQAFPISRDPNVEVSVGRGPLCTIRLQDETASELECIFVNRDGRTLAIDRGSRNGMWIDGECHPKKFMLHGEHVAFGASTTFLYAELEIGRDQLLTLIQNERERRDRLDTLRLDRTVRTEAAIYYRDVSEAWPFLVNVLVAISTRDEVPVCILEGVLKMVASARRVALLLNGPRRGAAADDFATQVFRDREASIPFTPSWNSIETTYRDKTSVFKNSLTPPVACVPLFTNNLIRGVLYLEAFADGRSGFDAEQMRHVEGVAKVAVVALGLAQEFATVRNQVAVLKEERDDDVPPVSKSPAMQRVWDLVKSAADSDIPVLISGETGAGKDVVGRRIHQLSPRRDLPMVAVNCAAIPASLMESELFGHEKGAFTGATEAADGKFKMAHNSTLLLDEIGEMDLLLQPKLLRVLQDKKVIPVGGKREFQCNVRVISSTNANLTEKIAKGQFRQDLYYRIKVLLIEVPPLRQRKEDIPDLIAHFVEKYRHEGEVTGIAPDALAALIRYGWPGNVRELENFVRYAVCLAKSNAIGLRDLPPELTQTEATEKREIDPLRLSVNLVTKAEIERALVESGGNVGNAAGILEISRRTLYRRMKELGM